MTMSESRLIFIGIHVLFPVIGAASSILAYSCYIGHRPSSIYRSRCAGAAVRYVEYHEWLPTAPYSWNIIFYSQISGRNRRIGETLSGAKEALTGWSTHRTRKYGTRKRSDARHKRKRQRKEMGEKNGRNAEKNRSLTAAISSKLFQVNKLYLLPTTYLLMCRVCKYTWVYMLYF